MPPQSVLPETTAVGLTKEALEVLNAKAMDGKAMAAAEVCACCGISVSLHHALIASCIPMGRNNMCSTEKKGSITMTACCCLAGTGHAKKRRVLLSYFGLRVLNVVQAPAQSPLWVPQRGGAKSHFDEEPNRLLWRLFWGFHLLTADDSKR